MSFDPPLLALGFKKDARNFSNIEAGGAMAFSFLGSGRGDPAFAFFAHAQKDANDFAIEDGRVPSERTDGGAPVLTQAPAWADLKLVGTVETGDHAVVVAEVTDVGLRQESPGVLTRKELGLNCGG